MPVIRQGAAGADRPNRLASAPDELRDPRRDASAGFGPPDLGSSGDAHGATSRVSRLASPPVSGAAAVPAPPGGGPLLTTTRLGIVVLLLLALANGAWLYLVPGRALTDYAWAIKPSINAAFIGAGFLAGTVATALVVFRARSWRSLRVLPLPLAVLATTVLSATLLHEDRFFWDYAPTWGWTGVYAVVPALVIGFWIVQERAAGALPAPDPRLLGLRRRSAVLGAILAAIGLALFAAPTVMADVWPWPITPLLARVIAGWYFLTGSLLLVAAVSLRRCHEVAIPYATLLAWSVLLLALPLLHGGDLTDRPIALAVWIGVLVCLLALSVSALARVLPLVRSGAERL